MLIIKLKFSIITHQKIDIIESTRDSKYITLVKSWDPTISKEIKILEQSSGL
jgi:hypothetical protein